MILIAFIIISLVLAPSVASVQVRGRYFDKYVVVVLENMNLQDVLNNEVFKEIASTGILLDNYHAVSHPSQPNYWALIAGAANFPGSTFVANTSTPFVVNGDNGDDDIDIWNETTIVDLLDRAGLSFTTYSEAYPTEGKCFLGTTFQDLYERKHNPSISFETFTDSSTRCASQKSFDQLYLDISDDTLPNVSFIVPNMMNDNHDSTTAKTAMWYEQFASTLFQSSAFLNSRVLVHVVYDEDDTAYTYYHNAPKDRAGNPNPYYNASCTSGRSDSCAPTGCTNLLDCTLDKSNNKVYSVLLGSAIPSSRIDSVDSTYYTHYSVPATLQANWDLGNLGRYDRSAHVFALS